MDYIHKHEGKIPKPYKDSKGNYTAGVGHKITDKEKHLLKNKKDIPDTIIEELFKKDCLIAVNKAKSFLPKFLQYPLHLQAAIVDGFFRGDLAGSSKTLKLMRAGKWNEAARQYLHNEEYKQSLSQGTGIWKRIQENSFHFSHFKDIAENSSASDKG
jgi:GH24 family phage-related lysozyme (muramidase)